MRNSKILLRLVITVIVVVLVIAGLDLALYPCTFMRNDVHAVSTEPYDVLIFGTSTGKMNLDPDTMLAGTGLNGHNMCVGGETPMDAYFILKLALEKQKGSVSHVIYAVDPEDFTSEKEPGSNYLLCYHEFPVSLAKYQYFCAAMPDTDIRNPWFAFYEYARSSELPLAGENLRLKLTGDYSVEHLKGQAQAYHENGWIEEFPVNVEDFPSLIKTEFTEDTVCETSISYLEKLIALCESEGIEFTAVSAPLPITELRASGEDFKRAWEFFVKFFEEHGVTYYNFNGELLNTYSHEDVDYVDYAGHMDGEHALKFSAYFGELLFE